jgi:antitoxin ParD1/3/4
MGSYDFVEWLLTKGFSMQITLELSPDVEVRLRESVADGDAEAIRRLLEEALTPTVEALLREASTELTDTEFEVVADQLADELTASLGSDVPSLSDYAVSRAGIYEDHP